MIFDPQFTVQGIVEDIELILGQFNSLLGELGE